MYYSPNIKPKTRLMENVAHVRQTANANYTSSVTVKGKGHVGDLSVDCRIIVEMVLEKQK